MRHITPPVIFFRISRQAMPPGPDNSARPDDRETGTSGTNSIAGVLRPTEYPAIQSGAARLYSPVSNPRRQCNPARQGFPARRSSGPGSFPTEKYSPGEVPPRCLRLPRTEPTGREESPLEAPRFLPPLNPKSLNPKSFHSLLGLLLNSF